MVFGVALSTSGISRLQGFEQRMICRREGCDNTFERHGTRAYCDDCPEGRRNSCFDCKAQISKKSKRCHACAKNHPEYQAKLSKVMKAKWEDPDYRERAIAAKNAPEARAKLSASKKAQWRDPAFRKKVHAANSRPETKAKRSAASNKRWSKRRAQLALVRAAHERALRRR